MKLSRNVPLNAMRVLESAARHLSFTRAGEELGMTQTAVSYQIKLLEDFVGAPLFLRKPRQVELTQTGELLAGRASQAFGILATALEEARNRTADVLIISCTTTFAHQWLAKRLGVFQARYPKLSLQLCLSNEMVDFARTNVDIGIRWGKGDWPGLISRRIMRLDFAPVVSPKLAETIGGLKHPADILKLPIVSPNDRWWKHWFAEAGVTETDLDTRTGSDFGIQNLEAQAAIAGHGVAIINPVHFAEDIASGRLLQPFELVCNDGHDYWIVYQEGRSKVAKIKAFSEWMEEEFPTET